MKQPEKCPKCGQAIIAVEYANDDKYHYDGVSEYNCANTVTVHYEEGFIEPPTCDWRIGRWCGQVLKEGEVEPRFCAGNGHPRQFNLE